MPKWNDCAPTVMATILPGVGIIIIIIIKERFNVAFSK